MDKKELKRIYKEKKPTAGVFQIKNSINGKVLLHSSLNLHGLPERHKFELNLGSHQNDALQEDWKKFGAEHFIVEILETLPLQDDPDYDYAEDLSILEQIWIDRLQPFGEKGYNKNARIRQA